MTFAQRRNRLTTHFSERIPVVKQRISVCVPLGNKRAGQLREVNKELHNLQHSLNFTQNIPRLQMKESYVLQNNRIGKRQESYTTQRVTQIFHLQTVTD